MSAKKKNKVKDIIYELDNADLSPDEDEEGEGGGGAGGARGSGAPKLRRPIISITFNEPHSQALLAAALRDSVLQLAQAKGYKNAQAETLGRQLLVYGLLSDGLPDDARTEPAANSDRDALKVESEDDSNSLFFEDVDPSNVTNDDGPKFHKKFAILDIESGKETSDSPETQSKPKFSRPIVCFNCGEGHSLKNCPIPKNFTRINQNRNNKQSKRYHLEDENKIVGKDGGFIPGRISAELRDALGLRKNQLPHHIYRMRVLGYPPGWLLHAKITHSGIDMFDSSGKKVADPDTEDGEIEIEGLKDKYDIKKIYDFPGFNVPASSRYVDESEELGYPPMFEVHSKKMLIERLTPRKAEAYKKKKLKIQSGKEEKHPEDVMEHADMDVDDGEFDATPAFCFVPPLPEEAHPSPPLPPPEEEPPAPGTTPKKVHEESMDSQSLADLEMKKRELMAALETSESNLEGTPKSKHGTVKNSLPGTPLLVNVSPFDKLPSDAQFGKGICDVINFENLPDATGKYEKMSSLIKKVRTVVEKIQHEDL